MKKILVIEDDPRIAAGLSIRLKAAGYEAFVACDGLTGLSTALRTKPNLILLDISMPAGDGFFVAERVQALSPTLVPIIFLTASKKPEFRERAAGLGAVAFFEKPYQAEDLLLTVRSALGQSAPSGESRVYEIAEPLVA